MNSTSAGSVLVTGGAGYIGSHVILTLLEAGYRVVVIDDLSTGWREAIPEGVTRCIGDIGDAALVGRTIGENGVATVMHFAGSVVVSQSVDEPLAYYSNNTVKSWALIDAAARGGVSRFVFSSTAAVYGHAGSVPIAEDAPTAPINPYGWSKLMTERMLADASSVSDLHFAVLRYFNVAGADPLLRTGQRSKAATHLIKVACEAAVGKRDYVNVFGTDFPTPDGTALRDYIHVTDLAAAHLAVLRWLEANPASDLTANCGYGAGYSVAEVLDALDRVTDERVCRIMAPRRSGDPATLVADSRRLVELTGWKPQFADLDTIVKHAFDWERALASQ